MPATALAVVSTGLSIFGMASGRSAARKQARAERQAAEFNATILEGNAEEVLRTAEFNSQVYDYNIEQIREIGLFNENLALRNADAAEVRGEFQAGLIRRQGRQLKGRQMAAYTNANVQMTGSALDVMRDSQVTNELDALMTIYNSMVEADNMRGQAINIARKRESDIWNTQVQQSESMRQAGLQSENLKKQAQLERMRGSVTSSSIMRQSNAQTLSGLANVASRAYDMNQAGLFTPQPRAFDQTGGIPVASPVYGPGL